MVLLAGVPLFIGSEQTDQYFAWTIRPPLTAAVLGALYWSAVPFVFLSAREREWANARLAVPGVLVFTTLGLLATVLHADRFHFTSPVFVARAVAWAWLAIYVLVPPITAILLVSQLRRARGDPARSRPLPRLFTYIVAAQGAVMLLAGATLFLAPEAAGARWPWDLTPLTSRAIGAWLVGLGVTAAQAAWEGDRARIRVGLVTYAVAGTLVFVALARYGDQMRAPSIGAFAFVLFVASVLAVSLIGLAGFRRSA